MKENWLFAAIAVVVVGFTIALFVIPGSNDSDSSASDAVEIADPGSRPDTPAAASANADSETADHRPTTAASPSISHSAPADSPSPGAQQVAATPANPTAMVTQPPAQSPQQVAAALRAMISEARANQSPADATNSQASTSADAPTPSSGPIGSFVAPTIVASAPTSQQPVSSPTSPVLGSDNPTADSPAEVLEIQVPPGARLPAALADGPADQDLSPAQLSMKETVAQEFLDQTATASPDGSDVATWNRLAADADERLRKMIGHDAFNRMTLAASQEALEQQPAPPASTDTPSQDPEIVTQPAPTATP